jgi:hypothetical protein
MRLTSGAQFGHILLPFYGEPLPVSAIEKKWFGVGSTIGGGVLHRIWRLKHTTGKLSHAWRK